MNYSCTSLRINDLTYRMSIKFLFISNEDVLLKKIGLTTELQDELWLAKRLHTKYLSVSFSV